MVVLFRFVNSTFDPMTTALAVGAQSVLNGGGFGPPLGPATLLLLTP